MESLLKIDISNLRKEEDEVRKITPCKIKTCTYFFDGQYSDSSNYTRWLRCLHCINHTPQDLSSSLI